MPLNEEPKGVAFDNTAAEYDRTFTWSSVGNLQRQQVYHYLEKQLPAHTSLKIIEINCGTGEDALWFAGKGHKIIASDISGQMIEIAKKKLAEKKNKPDVIFTQIAFDELKNNFSRESIDLIFSDFGGLNCIDPDSFKALAIDFYQLLKPGGKFTAVIMGRKCLWEFIYFLLKGNPRKAFRRLNQKGTVAPVGTMFQEIFYYAPSEISNMLHHQFSVTTLKPIGLFLPPSYLEPFFKNKKRLLKSLNFLERMSRFSFLSNYADHYIISFEKK